MACEVAAVNSKRLYEKMIENEIIVGYYEVLFRRSGGRTILDSGYIHWEDYKMVGSRLPIIEFGNPMTVLKWLCERPLNYGKARRHVKEGDIIHQVSYAPKCETTMFMAACNNGGKLETCGLLLVEMDETMPPYSE